MKIRIFYLKNKYLIFLIFIFLFLVNYNLIIAITSDYDFNESTDPNLIVSNIPEIDKIKPEDIDKIKQNIHELSLYLRSNKLKGQKLSIDSVSGTLQLKDSKGLVLLQVPKGVSFHPRGNDYYFEGDSGMYTRTEERKKTVIGGDDSIEEVIEHYSLTTSDDKIFEGKVLVGNQITITKSAEGTFFTFFGNGQLKISSSIIPGSKGVDKIYDNIKEGKIELDKDNNVVFADIVSNGADYEFTHKGTSYGYRVNPGGRLLFDPRNNLLTGTSSTLDVSSTFVSGVPFNFKISSTPEFKLNLDSSGNLVNLHLEERQSFDYKGIYSSSSGTLNIYFDNREIKDLPGNHLSFDLLANSDFIKIKGKVIAKPNNLFYQGLEEKTYTELDLLKSSFDVLVGDAKINNRKHEIMIKDGIAKYKLLDASFIADTSFSVVTHNSQGKTEVAVDRDSLSITLIDNSGNIKIVSVDFSKLGRSEQDISDIFSMEIEIESQVSNLKSLILKLDDAIKIENDPIEKQKLIFRKITYEQQLANLNGEDYKKSINDLRSFIQNSKDPLLIATAQRTLGDWLLSSLERDDIPKLVRITQTESTGPDVLRTTSIYAEVINSKVSAFIIGDKRVPASLDPARILEELQSEINKGRSMFEYPDLSSLEEVISETKKNSLELSGFNTPGVGFEIVGISKTSTNYRNLESLYTEAWDNLQKAKEYYSKLDERSFEGTGQTKSNILGRIDLDLARSLRFQGSETVIDELLKITESSRSERNIISEAKRLIGITLFTDNPKTFSLSSLNYLSQAVVDDPNNFQAYANLLMVQEALLTDQIGLEREVSKNRLEEFDSTVGEGDNPVYNVYLLITGAQQHLDKLQTENELANLRLAAAIGMRNLVNFGIDLQEYSRSSPKDRLLMLIASNSLDSSLTLDQINDLMQKSDFSLSPENIFSNADNIKTKAEELYGPDVAENFLFDFARAIRLMHQITQVTSTDSALFLIANKGKTSSSSGLNFNGVLDENALTRTKKGEEISATGLEWGLWATGEAAKAYAYGFLGKGISIAAKGALGVRLAFVGKASQALQTIVNPVESSMLMISKGSAPLTTSLLTGVADAGVQFAVNKLLVDSIPGVSAAYNFISNLGGAGAIDEKSASKALYNVIQDPKTGKMSVFIRAESEEAASKLANELRKKGISDIVVGTKIPDGHLKIRDFSLDDVMKETKQHGTDANIGWSRVNDDISTKIMERNVPDNEILGNVRPIDLERIELDQNELSRISMGSFTKEENNIIRFAEEKLHGSGLLNKGEHLSLDKQIEILISHNSANSLYGIDDYARVSTKSRLLEHFSLKEKKVLMKNWITGKGDFLDSTNKFVKTSERKIKGFSSDELSEFIANDADEVSIMLTASDFGGKEVNYEVLDGDYGRLYKALPDDSELRGLGIVYLFRKNNQGLYIPVGITDGKFTMFSISKLPAKPSITIRTPEELRGTKFDSIVYVRLEWVSSSSWPKVGEIGNLPFQSEMVNPKRGPRLSSFTMEQLDKDRFFIMTKKQQDEYLKKFGIDSNVRNRRMIFYQIEEGTKTELYRGRTQVYTNIIIDGKVVPAVKILDIR